MEGARLSVNCNSDYKRHSGASTSSKVLADDYKEFGAQKA